MAKFTVWIVRVAGNDHWQGLLEVAKGVVYSLETLGHEVAFATNNPGMAPGSRLIVFNAHLLPPDWKLPDDAILFNAEQVRLDVQWKNWHYTQLLRKHRVWDYSETNIECLRELGVEHVVHCRVGYWPGLARFAPTEETVDVLFIGPVNDRRLKVIQELDRRKLLVKILFGVYGDERDRWIARPKVIVNIHFYPEPIFEIFRVSHLLANRKCVVTEDGGRDKELETLAMATTAYVFYENIADECARLVKDADRRREIATRGHDIFSKLDSVEFVRDALGKS